MNKLIYSLSELDKRSIPLAGGKGASLGELLNIGMPVPLGFVVSAKCFERFLEETDINVETEAMWKRINIKDMASIEENSEILRDVIIQKQFPEELGKNILAAFDALGAKQVAVRSSATAEDSAIDAWAGQLDSFLFVQRKKLLSSIQKCWASLYTPRALFYRVERGMRRSNVSVAVVVQNMIASEVSGVCFTVHPVTQDRNQMIIEACWGLGEALVQGMVTPDSYILEKDTGNILDINISSQTLMIVQAKQGVSTQKVPRKKQEMQKLSKTQIKELGLLCLKIEKHYALPVDIEWARERNQFFIVQARPITTLKKQQVKSKNKGCLGSQKAHRAN